MLVRVDALKVTSRTSAFQFKGSKKGIPAIAQELKVRHVLEGSVRKAGDNIRITAQLIDAQNDKHLWSETYDRPLTTENIFAIQDEISNAIVQALSLELGIEAVETVNVNASTDNLTAYELYLKTKPLIAARIELNLAEDYLNQAIALDESYTKAWEMKAVVVILKISYGYLEKKPENFQLAISYAKQALKLDANSAQAIITIASVRQEETLGLVKLHSIQTNLDDYNRAITIDPYNPLAYNWLGLAYMAVGDLPAALESFTNCVKIEPNYLPCVSNVIEVHAELGQDEEALVLLDKALSRNLVKIYNISLGLMARAGEKLLFKVITNSPLKLPGFRQHDELFSAFQSPDKDHSKLIDSIKEYNSTRTHNTRSEEEFSSMLILVGDYDQHPFIAFTWGNEFKRYRQSSQYKAYIHKSGIYQYWSDTGFPAQCKSLGENDFECD